MKLAIAGCGRIASVHYEAIERLVAEKNLDITVNALIDTSILNAQNFKNKHQLSSNIYISLDEALKQSEFDSILICVPHSFHESLSLRSFENGKHVLLEKPMAHNLSSAWRILKQSKTSRKVFMIAENSQYWPEVNRVKELLNAGSIGKLITVKASFRQSSSNDIFDSYSLLPGDQLDKAWRFDKESTGGGITIDGGAHWIRPLRIWFNDVIQTMAKFAYPHPGMDGESLSQAIFLFDNDISCIFEGILTERTCFSPEPPFRITGTLGEIVVGSGGLGVYLYNHDFPEGEKILKNHGYISSFYYQFDDFYQCTRNANREPTASAEYSLGEMKTALAMEESDQKGQWIQIQYS